MGSDMPGWKQRDFLAVGLAIESIHHQVDLIEAALERGDEEAADAEAERLVELTKGLSRDADGNLEVGYRDSDEGGPK
jgi:hypothetical protein